MNGLLITWLPQVNTNMQQQWVAAYPGLLGKMIKNVSLALGRDVEQGSYSGLYAAIHPEIVEKNYNGYYFTDPVSIPNKRLPFSADIPLRLYRASLARSPVRRMMPGCSGLAGICLSG